MSHRCESVRASVAFGSATYLREEPDALRSARPDPSGGYYASGIPTGFANRQTGEAMYELFESELREQFTRMHAQCACQLEDVQ